MIRGFGRCGGLGCFGGRGASVFCECGRGVQSEAAPGLGDDDAVGGIVRIVADLNGQVNAEAADVIGQSGDDLTALVGDAGDAVVVDDDLRRGRRLFVVRRHVGDASVGDAATVGKEIATMALELFGSRSGAFEKVPGNARCSRRADCNGSEASWGTKREEQLGWMGLEHSLCSKG
jgi:hypothetical protein